MPTNKKKSHKKKTITINGLSKSDMEPSKNTTSEFKKKTLGVLRHYEEEDFKKCLEIEMYREGAYYTKLEKDRLEEENEKLKERNKYLEKNNGDKQIKEFHNELKKDHLTDDRKEEIKNEYEEKKRAFFESQGILKYLNDPKISSKKKRKS